MPKEQMKEQYSDHQERRCALCGELLSEEMALVDTDRPVPKASGGEYRDPNVRVVHPVCHMKSHGTHRKRDEELEHLKSIIDDRQQVMKLAMKVNNQLLAYKRKTDHLNDLTQEWLKTQAEIYHTELKARDKLLIDAVKALSKVDPFVKSALGVKGIGPITIGFCRVYIELDGIFPEIDPRTKKPHPRAGQEKTRHASSLWAYVGLDKASKDRYEKGVAGGGNKTLRTMLYNTACSCWKSGGPYHEVGMRLHISDDYRLTESEIAKMPEKKQKELAEKYAKHPELIGKAGRLDVSEKLTWSRNTKGAWVHIPWKDTKPSHRHGAALRAIMKHFLADYWYVGRTLMGLSTSPGYAEAILGKEGHRTINPKERGWIF